MPQLPYTSQISARTGRTNSEINSRVDPNAFGASIGQAMGQASKAIGYSADVVAHEAERERRESIANNVASFDFTKQELELRNQVDENATDYQQLAIDKFNEAVDAHVDTIEDGAARTAARKQLLAQLPNVSARAAQYEFTVRGDNSKSQANQALSTLRNKVLSDPTYYDQSINESFAVLDARPDLSASMKEGMKQMQRYNLTKDRFDGLLNKATSIEDYDALRAELGGKGDRDWQSEMMPKDFEDTVNKIHAAKTTYVTQLNAAAKSSVKNLEDRADDPTTLIAPEELAQTAGLVAQSTDPEVRNRMARVSRNQQIISSERRFTPAQLRQRMEQTKNTTVNPQMPTVVSDSINKAAADFGVNASYLEATVMREFGGELAKPNPDFGAKNPEPGATSLGVMQFTEKTFRDLVKDPAVAASLGIDTANMTDAQILALRADPQKSVLAGAILAKKNKSYMEGQLGRPVTDVELYMAHFLGAPEATRFVRLMNTDPSANAAAAFPAAAGANANVFKAKGGKELTVAEVYGNVARTFVASSSRVAYDDNQLRQKMLDKMETALNGPEAMKYAASVGVVSLVPLDQEGAFPARAKALENATEYYGRSLQPFVPDELAYMQKQIEDGGVESSLRLMTDIQSMGPKGARAAFNQLKVKSPAFAHAGSLALDGDPAVASDIVRGVKRMKENPASLTGLDVRPETATVDFESTVGPSLSRISPTDRQAAQEAALAYLVETKGAAGKKYSSSDYKQAVQKVLGDRIGNVNGDKTYLPKGVSERDVERMLAKMTLEDYVSMSVDGSTPLHADGSAADPRDLQDEVKLRVIGNDKYIMTDGSGAFLWTGRTTPDGYPEKFIMELKPERIRSILGRR